MDRKVNLVQKVNLVVLFLVHLVLTVSPAKAAFRVLKVNFFHQ